MKKARIHIYAICGLFVLTFILGSFCDLSLSQNIAHIDNNFGRFFSTIGTIPGYGVLAIIGGAFFQIGLKRKDYTTPIRFLL
ncbi:MAG: hypothetical protein K5925_00440, partial [Bacilli bacterium]|nr:hypothetical protein [Bacilli bacterium]